LPRASRSKNRAAYTALPSAVKGLAVITIAYMALRVLSSVGAEDASEKYVAALVSDGRLAGSILSFELGGPARPGAFDSLAARIVRAALPAGSRPSWTAAADMSGAPPAAGETAPPSGGEPSPGGNAAAQEAENEDLGLYYDLSKEEAFEKDIQLPTVITKPAAETSAEAIAVNNKAGYDVNIAALLKEPLDISISGDSPAVLIIHTHGSEAYLPDKENNYEPSDPYRTQEKKYSVIRVGDELASVLAERGIAFIHDRNIYDYPSYQGSYSRSYEAIQSYLEQYPSIKIVIDLHRDAIEAADGSVYKTIAQIEDTTCAQVMLVMGTDAAGLKHPKWRENFKLALHLQKEMNTLYPSLAKPVELSQYRYNQQATTGSMLLEVGCTGNTLQEALTAVRYFGEAAANVISRLYK
jgi:stage II sporulation protein P